MDGEVPGGDNQTMRKSGPRGSARVAVVLWLLSLALAGCQLVLSVLNRGTAVPGTDAPGWLGWLYLVTLSAMATVGAVIASRRPRNPLGWLFIALALNELVATAGIEYGTYVLFTSPGAGPAGDALVWVGQWQVALSLGIFALVLLLYPDGHLPSPRWRPLAVAGGVVATAAAVTAAIQPGPMEAPGVPSIPNPLGVEAAAGVLAPLVDLLFALVVAFLVAGVCSLILRFRRTAGDERQQVKWLLFPAAVEVGSFALAHAFHLAFGTGFHAVTWPVLVGIVAGAGVPVGAAFGILKYRLLDIDLIIRRSLVYGGLWVVITVAYLGTAAAFGIATGGRLPLEVAILVTILTTLAFQPFRRALDRVVGRWVFGERPTQFQVLTEFGETLEHAGDPADLSVQLADTIRRALEVRWARVLLELGGSGAHRLEPTAAAGAGLHDDAVAEVTVPLIHGGEQLGAIECGPKREGEFSERDHEVLVALARQAALGIGNARLASQLAASLDEIRRQAEELVVSRARIVHAQDSERRRLERDIHDGVQQELVSLMAKLRLARNQLNRGELSDAALAELQAEARQTLEDLRELAHGIHPPVLTDRGLVAAIEARTARLPLGVRIEADAALRQIRFSPDVEAAAYFSCSEALANVLKHARATHAVVRLTAVGDRLQVEVEDDGVGFDRAVVPGTGLEAMRDRLEALGGTLRVRSGPGQGCLLVAELPGVVAEATDA